MKALSPRTIVSLINLFVNDIEETVQCSRLSEFIVYHDLLADTFAAIDELGIKRADIFNYIAPKTRKKLRRMLRRIDEYNEVQS